MANDREIIIKISADGTAAIAGIRSVGDATEKLGSTSALDSFKKNWLEVTAGITGAYLAFQKIWGLMDAAAEHAEKMETLDALTRRYGTTAQGLVDVIAQNSHGLIGVGAAANVAADALAKGFSPAQVAQMANVAAVMHKTSSEGLSASEAFKTLEGSITAARERGVVKMMGATIDLASSMGKQYEAMSKSEKAQAMLNAVTERAAVVERALGDEYDSAADRMQRFNNSIERMKLFFGDLLLIIGQPFMAIIQTAMTLIYGLVGAFDALVSEGARLTDWLNITSGATERWAKKSDDAYTLAAQSAVGALENIKGALASIGDIGKTRGTGEGLGGGPEGNVKRAEQLAEIMRKIREAQTLAEAADIDKSRIQANAWFDEQVKKLHDLGASDAEYSALVVAYASKRHADIASWATKTSDFYLEVQRANVKENDEIEKDRNRRLFEEAERGARERQAIEDVYAKGSGDESDAIRRKAQGEQEILRIRQQALLASITEQTTFIETLRIMGQYATLENQIEESKRRQVVDLDVRRLQIERDIFSLKEQQAEIVRQSNLQTAQEAIGKLSGGASVSNAMTLSSDIEAGQDRYTREFTEWSKAQYDRIALLEELGGREAEIKEYWREWDLQQEQMLQQQKYAMAASTMGMVAGLAQNLFVATGSRNKALFEMMKVASTAEAIINTATGATKALSQGGFFGIAMAAAVVAAGMAQVATIQAQQFNAPSTGASVGGIGGGGGLSLAAASAPATQREATRSIVVNVQLISAASMVDQSSLDEFGRMMIPSITKAITDGVR